jgi:hypothetical protein
MELDLMLAGEVGGHLSKALAVALDHGVLDGSAVE